MAFEPMLGGVIGAVAGLLVVLVGTFVLYARPESIVARAFFAFALVDGLSTLAYRLALMASDAPTRNALAWLYWITYVLFVAAFAAFGLAFPAGSQRRSRRILAVWSLVGAALVALLLARPAWFFEPSNAAQAPFRYAPFGLGATLFLVAMTAIVLWKLADDMTAARVASQQRQSAVLFAGFSLSHAPYAGALVASALVSPAPVLALHWSVGAFYLGLGLFCLAYAFLAVHALRQASSRTTRRILVIGIVGVAVLSVASLLFPDDAGALVRALGLLAYPVLMAYAIVRYEVFDIDAKLRRALLVPLLGGVIASVVLVVSSLVENAIQARLASNAGAGIVSIIVAAIAASLLFVPITRLAKRALHRAIPSPAPDEVHRRRREIYRHSLALAMEDGRMEVRETQALASLRAALAISSEEHDDLLADVKAATRATA